MEPLPTWRTPDYVREIIARYPAEHARAVLGEPTINFLIGALMALSNGRGNPILARQLFLAH